MPRIQDEIIVVRGEAMIWEKLFIDQIELNGIHLDLLKCQSNGLTKHIGEVFKDLSDDSAWLGGKGEAWERGPYYLDGLIPLAYLLKDETLITLSNKWIDKIMASQDDSGFFGPRKNNDWWPRAVILKVMVSEYLATKNKAILTFINKYLDYLLKNIDDHPFDFWGYARGMEGKEMLDFLHQAGNNDSLRTLEKKLTENTLDWKTFFYEFPYEDKTDKYMNKPLFRIVKFITGILDDIKKRSVKPKVINKNKIRKSRVSKNNLIFLKTHGVNIAMALKYLTYWDEETDDVIEALDHILKYHGNASGIFSSDEHLNGTSPESGIELCTVVEMMYSMEEIIRLTGSSEACDRLEHYAYNALLATISNDFTAHQYVQQVNQLDCEVKPHPFYDAYRYANTFGIAPNYGCCAANMHQGWPKMMLSAVMKSKNHLGIFLYVSGTYTIAFSTGYIKIEIKTGYPYDDTVSIKCLENTVDHDIEWLLRIPFKTSVEIHHPQETIHLSNKAFYSCKALKKDETIVLNFEFDVKTIKNSDGSISVQRGPLLFSQAIDYEVFKIKGNEPFHDRGFKPKPFADIALVTKQGSVMVKNIKKAIHQSSFFDNEMTLTVEGCHVKTDKHEDIDLKPYGLTVLRKTQFSFKENEMI